MSGDFKLKVYMKKQAHLIIQETAKDGLPRLKLAQDEFMRRFGRYYQNKGMPACLYG